MNFSIRGLVAALAFAGAVGFAPSAQAGVILINFDAVTTGADVNQFYDGGTDSAAASGPNLGVDFSGFTTTTGFGETSQPNLAFNNAGTAIVNDAAGFTAVSFTFGFFSAGTFDVFSGLNGTGLLLGSFASGATNPNAFGPGSVAFSGVAESMTLTGGSAQLGIDDLALTVPEPSTIALIGMALLSLFGIGVMRRRA